MFWNLNSQSVSVGRLAGPLSLERWLSVAALLATASSAEKKAGKFVEGKNSMEGDTEKS